MIDLEELEERNAAIVSGLEAIVDLRSQAGFPTELILPNIENYLDTLKHNKPSYHHELYNSMLDYSQAAIDNAQEAWNSLPQNKTFLVLGGLCALPYVPSLYLMKYLSRTRNDNSGMVLGVAGASMTCIGGVVGGLYLNSMAGTAIAIYSMCGILVYCAPTAVSEFMQLIASLRSSKLAESKKKQWTIIFQHPQACSTAEMVIEYFSKSLQGRLQSEEAGDVRKKELLQDDLKCLRNYLNKSEIEG